MSSTLYRLGRAMARTPWHVIGAWGALLVLFAALAVGLGGSLNDDIKIPGTEAQTGLETLSTRFPEMAGASGQYVFVATDGRTVDAHAAEITATMKDAAEIDGVAAAPDPFDKLSPGTRNDTNTALIGNIQMEGHLGSFPPSALDELVATAKAHSTGGLEVHAGGQLFTETTVPFSIAEVLGVVFALVILAVTFRAIVPAAIPIVTAITGVGAAMAALFALAAGVDIPAVTPTLAIMLGLAVGIDYALFIVSRHRDQLRDGAEPMESIGQAIATSGSAVIFAGATVIIALVGLFVTGIPFLTLMGLASAFTVALAVLIALTLLPAILGLLGERLRPRPSRRARKAQERGAAQAHGEASNAGAAAGADEDSSARGDSARVPLTTRWARLVTRVPLLTIIIVILAVGGLALPAKDLRLGLPDLGTEPEGTMVRETYDLISDQFGAGYNTPLLLTADIINSQDPLGVVDTLKTRIGAMDHVEEIQLATPNRGADLAVVVIIPEGGQTADSTAQLVHELRSHREAWEKELSITDMTVTGQTAAAIDISQKLSDALLPFGIFVVGLSLVLLTIVFRSLWVPIKASLGYLLSVGAAFGAVTMVFEYGWGNSALGVGVVGPVISFMPIIVMGVLFGLAMDYEVFLVSRMREDYVHTGKARESVVTGFTASAGVVTAAALIMIAVFASFIPESTFMIQPIAMGLAVGVLVDAFVVRMTLVPAVLALLGARAWHLPRWLNARVPHLDVEGEGLGHLIEHREWTATQGRAAVRLEDVTVPLLGHSGANPPTVGPLTGAVAPGTFLVLRSPEPDARASVLALVAGRAVASSGRLAVFEAIAPEDLGTIQARALVINAGEDIAARLQEVRPSRLPHTLIVCDSLNELYRQRTQLSRGGEARDDHSNVGLLDDALEQGATIIVGADAELSGPAEQWLSSHLADPSRLTTLDLPRTTVALSEGAPA